MILGFSKYFWAFFAAIGFIFYFFPNIDLWFSGLFFKDGDFYLKDQVFIKFIYDITHPVVAAFFIAILFLLIYSIYKKREFFNIKKNMLIFILVSLIMAPGIVVNLTLKDNIDRARPKQVIEFGGDKKFTPAFVISDQCEKNCSFVCGHASAGFSFIALAMIFTGVLRRRIFIIATTAGFLIGLVRIIQGGHFLSDVVFAFFFTIVTIKLLYYLIVEKFTIACEKSV